MSPFASSRNGRKSEARAGRRVDHADRRQRLEAARVPDAPASRRRSTSSVASGAAAPAPKRPSATEMNRAPPRPSSEYTALAPRQPTGSRSARWPRARRSSRGPRRSCTSRAPLAAGRSRRRARRATRPADAGPRSRARPPGGMPSRGASRSATRATREIPEGCHGRADRPAAGAHPSAPRGSRRGSGRAAMPAVYSALRTPTPVSVRVELRRPTVAGGRRRVGDPSWMTCVSAAVRRTARAAGSHGGLPGSKKMSTILLAGRVDSIGPDRHPPPLGGSRFGRRPDRSAHLAPGCPAPPGPARSRARGDAPRPC